MNVNKILRSISVMVLFIVSSTIYAATDDPHAAAFAESDFPSADKCAGCHEQIYDEWSASAHAYAGLSPMFHKFEQAINSLAPTIGNFCVRCHQGVGTSLGESRATDAWDRLAISREGVTCVSCHRVNVAYGKVNGSRRMEGGKLNEAIYGASAETNLPMLLENAEEFSVKTVDNKEKKGQLIHSGAIEFEQLKESEFCVSCHQVAVNLGIKLEVVWDQYRASPAHGDGVSCQACHMGKVAGKDSGYEEAHVAELATGPVGEKRKHSNHSFYGPGYSIAHPGVFPHHPEAKEWTIKEWLAFDYRAGWGTEEFEDEVDDDYEFPEVWEDSTDREDAREVIEENLEKIAYRDEMRKEVMENGTHLDGPFFDGSPKVGEDLDFKYIVKNINAGHNVPSGSLGAQPEIWLNVALIDPMGQNVWESGYIDSNGDMADLHSLDVAAGTVAHDDQLFNLQTKFLTTNVKGTDREMYLPVNFDVDQLPFLRPAAQPVTVMNHPPFVRMESRSIPPFGTRDAGYSVPGQYLKRPGKYKLAVRLRSRAEPIYFMRFVGATSEMEQGMNEGMIDIHPYTVEFEVKR
jgi:nitrate/TMAO reductase-like tetraheme cytochrome c subunit